MTVDNTGGIKFSTVSNIPDGYSEKICVACDNGDKSGTVYKDNWIVE